MKTNEKETKMNVAMLQRVEELVDHHGSVALAIKARQAVIDRRAGEGKLSPAASAEIAALKELSPCWATPGQIKRARNMAESCAD